MTNKDTLAEMIEYRNKKWKHTVKHTTEWSILWEFLEDLQTLQAEQPKQEADIDKIMDEMLMSAKIIPPLNYPMVWVATINSILEAHLTQKTTVPKDGEVKIWTKILDDWVVKIISRLFTVSQESIENSSQNRREDVYVEFEWYWWDMWLSYIRQNCNILD